MKVLGVVKERTIVYQRYHEGLDLADSFPDGNWLLLAIVYDVSQVLLNLISSAAIDNNIVSVACMGKQGELLHDITDEEINIRDIFEDKGNLPPWDIMTTWHQDLDDALFYSTHCFLDNDPAIKTVFCLDTSGLSTEEAILDLINIQWPKLL